MPHLLTGYCESAQKGLRRAREILMGVERDEAFPTDLREEFNSLYLRMRRPEVRVMVSGPLKAGKSTLLNVLAETPHISQISQLPAIMLLSNSIPSPVLKQSGLSVGGVVTSPTEELSSSAGGGVTWITIHVGVGATVATGCSSEPQLEKNKVDPSAITTSAATGVILGMFDVATMVLG